MARKEDQPENPRPVPWPPIPQKIVDRRAVFQAADRVVECWHKWQYRRVTVIDAPIEQLELALMKMRKKDV